jgi:hypothetical protein
MNRFGGNAGNVFAVYSLYKGHGEAALLPKENPDLFHNYNLVKSILKFQIKIRQLWELRGVIV